MFDPKTFTVRSKKVLAAAEGRNCTLRIPGRCNHDPSTTVACHLPGHNSGTAKKVDDIHIAFGCSSCHDAIDMRGNVWKTMPAAVLLDAMLRGHAETLNILVGEGLISVAGFEI